MTTTTDTSDALDVATKMREVIDQHTADGPYTPRAAAGEIVAKLRQNDPELLAAWLDTQAEHFVWQAINDRDRSTRAHMAREKRFAAYRNAAAAHDGGDQTALTGFLDAPYTVGDGTRRKLGKLRHDDLVFVADTYQERARRNSMREAFIRALANTVRGKDTVADRFSEEQLAAMWQSISS